MVRLPIRIALAILAIHLFSYSTALSEEISLANDLDYTQTVDSWWAAHPLNPTRENGEPSFPSPGPILDVRELDSNIQKCIDALPSTGGTVLLPAGVYEGGFDIVGRSGIHLVGDEKVTIRGGENHAIGSELNRDYGAFCESVHRRESESMRFARELPARDIVFRNLVFNDSPVRLASSAGILFDGCTFEKEENREVGDVDEDGKKVLRWHRPLPVTGIMGLRGIWFRDCEFLGHHANGAYLDGAHGSGFLRCRFAGSDRLWHNPVLLFTNDDLSLDVNGNDRLEPFERRDTSYFVFDGCHFGGGYQRGAVAASGRDILIQNCHATGPIRSLLVMNAKTSGKRIFYEAFGVKVRNNTLENVSSIVTAEGPAKRPENGVPDWWEWTEYEIGRFEIRNNQVTGLEEALREIPRDGKIQGPHLIENNGPEAIGAP